MGGAAAGAAAGAVARARRRLISHFMASDAVSADKAIGYAPERGIERRLLERLIDHGVLHVGKAGTYWLDIPAYDKWNGKRRRRAGMMVGAAVAIGAALSLFAG
ncbi:MAG: hypothetical protein E7773_03415 [Sphingomonas sp.]|uniref:hypothetical protein n=1 Tax=Sphingomonas sp. TaxID=28214 RepID=UPI00120183D9|nr:hypothetical protein [Sphingomonas sp.]THD38032.1 MAG: hypothetical protein E7773_03415 [Sphingomonas sp.]